MEQRTLWIQQAIRLNAIHLLIITNEFAEEKFPVYIYHLPDLEPMKAQYENASFEHIDEEIDINEEKERLINIA